MPPAGWKIPAARAMRYYAMRCGATEAFVFWPDVLASRYYGSVPTNIPHLLLLFSFSLCRLALLHILIYSYFRLIHIYCIRAYPPACLLREFEATLVFMNLYWTTKKGKVLSTLYQSVAIAFRLKSDVRMKKWQLKVKYYLVHRYLKKYFICFVQLPVFNNFCNTFIMLFKKRT